MLGEAFAAIALLVIPAAAAQPSVPQVVLPADSRPLHDAAEHFEELTEKAFKSDAGELAKRLQKAEAALSEAKAGLAPEAAKETESELAAAKAAHAAGNRSDLAIASIEIYRILVSAVPADAKAPVEVSLLDYAGFRYRADLQSEPRRWDDMGRTLAYARARWSELGGRIEDAKLTQKLNTALAAMEEAVTKRDPVLARRAVNDVLDLVDDLERYFKRS